MSFRKFTLEATTPNAHLEDKPFKVQRKLTKKGLPGYLSHVFAN